MSLPTHKMIDGVEVLLTHTELLAIQAERDTYALGADARVAEQVRNTRDGLLSATDFYALSDVTMSQEMTTYRQALRDVTEQDGFPHAVNWPTIEVTP